MTTPSTTTTLARQRFYTTNFADFHQLAFLEFLFCQIEPGRETIRWCERPGRRILAAAQTCKLSIPSFNDAEHHCQIILLNDYLICALPPPPPPRETSPPVNKTDDKKTSLCKVYKRWKKLVQIPLERLTVEVEEGVEEEEGRLLVLCTDDCLKEAWLGPQQSPKRQKCLMAIEVENKTAFTELLNIAIQRCTKLKLRKMQQRIKQDSAESTVVVKRDHLEINSAAKPSIMTSWFPAYRSSSNDSQSTLLPSSSTSSVSSPSTRPSILRSDFWFATDSRPKDQRQEQQPKSNIYGMLNVKGGGGGGGGGSSIWKRFTK